MSTDPYKDAFVVDGKLALPYTYFAGATGSRFLCALRDEKKILGQHCPKCNKTIVPPRGTCERCFTDLKDAWVELGQTGVVTNFTIIGYAEPYQPQKPPYALALIKLDGADTPLAHIVSGDPAKVCIGQKVRVVFAEKRIGAITDIAHFEPI